MRTTIIILTLLLTGCVSQGAFESREYIANTGYDFRPYTQQGFLFTTEGMELDYVSIGYIRVVYNPSFQKIPTGGNMQEFEDSRVYQDPINPNLYWRVSEPDEAKMIQTAYDQASAMGADAIIRFQIKNIEIKNAELIVNSSELVGLAIKRSN